MQLSLDLQTLARAYAESALTPLELVELLHARLRELNDPAIFTTQTFAQARADAEAAMARRARGEAMRLYGVPFAVKDSIDIAGLPTTLACTAFAYDAERSAPVVARLQREGAILIGKTNLDQFATGLVGVRSPYGVARNPFDSAYVPGGSSSGSAVAVARGLCAFALGTDTAGSGRVPAAFNNVVGFKPSRGMLSTVGLVPACRSVDCMSVFALNVEDATDVATLLAGYDTSDPYSRPEAERWDARPGITPPRFRFAVPRAAQREFDAPEDAALFSAAIAAAERAGGRAVEIDFTPFTRAGALLYGGPWVAERLECAGELLARDPDALHPAVRTILEGARDYSAEDAFRALHALAALRHAVEAVWNEHDFLISPTTPGIPRIDEVLADPIERNARLGHYVNFANLLDLCALAVPAGFRKSGLPFGVTLAARRGRDACIASVARTLHRALSRTAGATGLAVPETQPAPARGGERGLLAVFGAHLTGEPLHHELADRGARFVRAGHTAQRYRMFALSTKPPKPGLVRVAEGERGHAIELELWELDDAALGGFLRGVRPPLCIGTVELEDGGHVLGFLCEGAAVTGEPDISELGGWRAFVAAR